MSASQKRQNTARKRATRPASGGEETNLRKDVDMNYGDLKATSMTYSTAPTSSATLTARFIDQGYGAHSTPTACSGYGKENGKSTPFPGQITEVTLPSDFIEIINIYHSAGNALTRVPMPKMREYLTNPHTGNPLYFTRQGAKLLLFPSPGRPNYYSRLLQ